MKQIEKKEKKQTCTITKVEEKEKKDIKDRLKFQ